MKKPMIKKKNNHLIVTCPYCEINFMATNHKEAEANYNRHYLFKHSNGDEDE